MRTYLQKRNYLSYLLMLCLIVLASCDEQEIKKTDVISKIDISKNELLANGSDVSNVKVYFNKASNISLIKLEVEINNGTIVESGKDIIELVPDKNLDGEIIAEFDIKSSTVNLDHKIHFKVNNYEFEEVITSIISIPSSVSIASSSFSVDNNFGSEITLEGMIRNKDGGKVSNGVRARFIDTYMDGSPVNGKFREENLSSNSQSKVSAIYSPGPIAANQYITLKVELIDDLGASIGLSKNIEVYINESD